MLNTVCLGHEKDDPQDTPREGCQGIPKECISLKENSSSREPINR